MTITEIPKIEQRTERSHRENLELEADPSCPGNSNAVSLAWLEP